MAPVVKVSYDQWEVDGTTLKARNLKPGNYLVVAIQDVDMQTTKNIDSLFNGISLSDFAKKVVNLSLRVSTYRYGVAAWGLTDFADPQRNLARNTFIPLRFND